VGTIPALVTPEQYELAQQKLARDRQPATRNNTVHNYLPRAPVSCGLCGLAATGRTAGAGYPSYVCAGKGADDYRRRVGGRPAGASFERRRLVKLLIDRVIVTDEEVETRYVMPTSVGGEHARFCHSRTNYLLSFPPTPE